MEYVQNPAGIFTHATGVLLTSPPAPLRKRGEKGRLLPACTGLLSGNIFGAIRLHGLLPSPCGEGPGVRWG
jgi:hypothetical protein